MIWNDLKRCLRTKIQPTNLVKLIAGIKPFWQKKVTKEKCNKKIGHLETVFKRALVLDGRATGI